jgi:hypothetical protein
MGRGQGKLGLDAERAVRVDEDLEAGFDEEPAGLKLS